MEELCIVLCGDSGTGKSVLRTLLCNKELKTRLRPTVGFQVEVSIYSSLAERVMVTFVEVSGKVTEIEVLSILSALRPSGILFTYNTRNKKSLRNVKLWARLIDKSLFCAEFTAYASDPITALSGKIPIFILGQKQKDDTSFEPCFQQSSIYSAVTTLGVLEDEFLEAFSAFLRGILSTRVYRI